MITFLIPRRYHKKSRYFDFIGLACFLSFVPINSSVNTQCAVETERDGPKILFNLFCNGIACLLDSFLDLVDFRIFEMYIYISASAGATHALACDLIPSNGQVPMLPYTSS